VSVSDIGILFEKLFVTVEPRMKMSDYNNRIYFNAVFIFSVQRFPSPVMRAICTNAITVREFCCVLTFSILAFSACGACDDDNDAVRKTQNPEIYSVFKRLAAYHSCCFMTSCWLFEHTSSVLSGLDKERRHCLVCLRGPRLFSVQSDL
jgi:hypothetical protein